MLFLGEDGNLTSVAALTESFSSTNTSGTTTNDNVVTLITGITLDHVHGLRNIQLGLRNLNVQIAILFNDFESFQTINDRATFGITVLNAESSIMQRANDLIVEERTLA